MKKIISLSLCVFMLLFLTLSVSALITGEDYLGMRFDLGEDLPAARNNLKVSIYEDALRMTTSVSNDAHAVFNVSFDAGEYPYIAIAYRVSHDLSQPWFYMKDESMPNFAPTAGTYTGVGWIMDGEWHKAVYSIVDAFPALANKKITGFRLPGGDLVGDTVDLRYICFFKTEEAANAFVGFPEEETTKEQITTVEETVAANETVADTETADIGTETAVESADIGEETQNSDIGSVTEPEVTSSDDNETAGGTETETESAAATADKKALKKAKIAAVTFSVLIFLCAVVLFGAYLLKKDIGKVFAAVIAVILLACSLAIVITFVFI